MKTIFLALLSLTTATVAQAEVRGEYVQGTCHLTTTDEAGTVVKNEDFTLATVNPWNHYGLAGQVIIEDFRVQVQLAVSRYDHIGAAEWDQVSLGIDHNAASSYQAISGRAFASGEALSGGLSVGHKLLSCKIKKI